MKRFVATLTAVIMLLCILPTFTFADTVKFIGDSAFYGCKLITSVSVPQGATAISSSAQSTRLKVIMRGV